MWTWWERSKKLIAVLVVCIVPLILLLVQHKGPVLGSLVKAPFIQMAGLVEQGITSCMGTISDKLYKYFYLVDRSNELLKLRQEVLKLHGLRARVNYLKQENTTILDLYYQSQSLGITRPTLARVIGRSEGPRARMIRIDKGLAHGIKAKNPVIAHDGAVGQVISVSQNFSDVLLLTDLSFALDARIVESNARGLLRGRARSSAYKMKMGDIDGLTQVNSGDTVVTSGINSHFPPGIPIGIVVSAQRSEDGLYISAQIRPFVTADRLTHVVAFGGHQDSQVSPVRAPWPMASKK